MGIRGKAEAANQVIEQLLQMKCAVGIVERNAGECWEKIYILKPFFDRSFEFSLQYSRHALWLLSHPASPYRHTLKSV
jgi:hypothetical protein